MNSSRKISCSQMLIMALVVGIALWTGGCGEYFAQKTTDRRVNKTISDLTQVKKTPEPNISIPEIYKTPPKIVEQIVGGAPEWKLFYFCKHHTSDELKQLVHDQFASKLFDPKGKSTRVVDYAVSSNPATNQLIVRCPAKEDADAVLEFLEMTDVPPIQVKINCLISEVYADRTLDRETTLEIFDLFGEGITMGGSARRFGTDIIQQLIVEGEILPAFPGGSLRELGRAKMGLKIGYKNLPNFLAVVDLLESKGYLKILMNPTLEVVNGKTAKISTKEHMPLQETFLGSLRDSDWFESKIEYYDVISSLEITPHVFSGNYIGLETKIILGSKSTPEGIKQVSIITEKEIENFNRIRQGESLVIGGIRKCEQRDVTRGVPFLQDIPFLGLLFSSRDFEERVVETIFILTPSISTGGIPHEEMIEEVKRRHDAPTPETLHEAVMDAFDILDSKRERQRKTDEAEQSHLEAKAEKAEARAAIRDAGERVKRAKAEAEKAVTKAEKATAAEKQAKTEAEKAKADVKTATEKAVAAEKQGQAEIEKLKAEAEKLKAETEKAKVDVQKATAEAEKAKADAQKATAEAEKAKADAEKAKAEADAKEKQEVAEETKEETEQAKTEKPEQESGSKEESWS